MCLSFSANLQFIGEIALCSPLLDLSPVCLSVNQFCIHFPGQRTGLSVLTSNSQRQKTPSSPASVYLTVTRQWHLPPPSSLLAVSSLLQPVRRSVSVTLSPRLAILSFAMIYSPVHTHTHTLSLSLSSSSSIAIPERNRLVWQWVVYVHEPGDTPATAALICCSQRRVGTAAWSKKVHV